METWFPVCYTLINDMTNPEGESDLAISLKEILNMKKSHFAKIPALLTVLACFNLNAAMVSYQNVSPGAQVTITIDFVDPLKSDIQETVLAGIYNLKVDGVLTPSFCIDVQRNSSTTSQLYNYASLENAPLSWAGPMNSVGAKEVELLWGNYFAGIASQTTTSAKNAEAAALQLAIWQAVADGNGNTYDVLATGSIATRAAYMRTHLDSTKKADLIALMDVTDPKSQAFVVVPEPTTLLAGFMLLLPFAASTIRRCTKGRH